MSKQTKENEEVDLGALFVVIGNGFAKLGNAITSILKGAFHLLIQLLLFLKKNVIKLAVATLVGAVFGLVLEFTSETKYEANLYVKPNFSSARQLYNNVQFYNDLVKQKNIEQITSIFNITQEEAKSLKKFEIQPVINENDILTSYDDLTQSIDTSTVRSYSYEKFKNAFTKYDFKVHEITVSATKDNIFSKLDEAIISSIINNGYFKTLKQINRDNLLRTDSLLRKNLVQADSLHYVYKQVLVAQAKKANPGTSINLSGKEESSANKEQSLFVTKQRLNNDLVKVNEDLSEKSEVINIVSNFQPIGHKVKEIEKNKGFQLGVVGFGVMILILIFLQLNAYLESYSKSKS
jgi:hypothetical protein